jgi:hypothetical protein
MALSANTAMAQKPSDHNFEVGKQLDILNHVYKNLDLLYVDTLNPKTTIGTAINAMLRSLDPYTEYYAQEEKKLVEEIGGVIQEDGAILFPDQDEGMKKLSEGRAEVLDQEWDVAIDTPIIFRDAECVQVSGNDIETLDGLADFKD